MYGMLGVTTTAISLTRDMSSHRCDLRREFIRLLGAAMLTECRTGRRRAVPRSGAPVETSLPTRSSRSRGIVKADVAITSDRIATIGDLTGCGA